MASKKKASKPKRKSKAESMTGKKAAEVEVRTIGDNSQLPLPKPDDYKHHMKTIKGALDRVETAKSLLNHAKSAANKSCPGMADSIKQTLQIERENDPAALQKRLEMLGIGLDVIGHTLQLTVWDTLAGDEEDMVYKRGHADGAAGRTASNKYPENSTLAETYARGWRDGTASNLGLTAEQAEAAEQ
jgi:hypothetical protein